MSAKYEHAIGIRPFEGLIVRPEFADEVIAPAYDALTCEQRKQYRIDNDRSFLHVTRTPEDEADGEKDHEILVERGRESLEQLISSEAYKPLEDARYLAYRLSDDTHSQIGLICLIEPEHFATRNRPHEATRSERSDLLATHFQTVKAASSPIACMLSKGDGLADLLESCTTQEPILDVTSTDGLAQTLWLIEPSLNEKIEEFVDDANLYIVDGHHRAEANRKMLLRGNPRPVLACIFASSSMLLAGFHRLVTLPEQLQLDDFIDFIARRFKVTKTEPVQKIEEGTVVLAAKSEWFLIELDERPTGGGPVVQLGSTDPAVIQREILGMIKSQLNIDVGVEYVSGDCPLEEVVEHGDSAGQVCLLLRAVEIDDIIDIARGGLLMPAKSTYFTPKVRSGIFIHLYEDTENAKFKN